MRKLEECNKAEEEYEGVEEGESKKNQRKKKTTKKRSKNVLPNV